MGRKRDLWKTGVWCCVRVEQVGELAHSVGETRRRPGVIAVGIHGDSGERQTSGPRRARRPRRHRTRTARSRRARARGRRPRPTSSGRTAGRLCRGCPCRRRARSSPGSQCPAQKGGSIHSAKNTRRRVSPRTASAAASIVSHIRATSSSPRSRRAELHRKRANRVGHVRQRSWVERDHVRAHRARRGQFAARDGADCAEILGHDQIRRERLDLGGVDGVEGAAVSDGVAHSAVDLEARQQRRVDPGSRHDRLSDDLGRPAALLGDTDERVDQPELRDDLRRARQ